MAARKGRGGLKRKREEDDTEGTATKKTSLPARPKQTEADEAIALMDPSLLADHFAKSIRKEFPDSSSLELEDRYLPTKAFRDTTGFDKTHVASNLPDFLEKFTGNGKESLVHSKKDLDLTH
jgi:protein CMS1